jgi:DNA-binding cell septation regulator SpoVG
MTAVTVTRWTRLDGGKVLGIGTIAVGAIAIDGVKLLEGARGRFVVGPSVQRGDEWRDVVTFGPELQPDLLAAVEAAHGAAAPREAPTCRDCGRPIGFVKLESGKWLPVEPGTTTAHGSTCPSRPHLDAPTDRCHRCQSRSVTPIPAAGPHGIGIKCLDCQVVRWLPKVPA